jgi:preprotein translocase subunit SecE
MAVSATTEDNSPSRGKVKDLSARLKGFYTDVRAEMKKVTAPSWKEVQGTTVVVLITVAIFGAFFYVVDYFLTGAVNWIIVHFSH